MANAYSALSAGTANTNGGLGGGQYTSADNVGTFTASNGAGLVQKAYDRLVEFASVINPCDCLSFSKWGFNIYYIFKFMNIHN